MQAVPQLHGRSCFSSRRGAWRSVQATAAAPTAPAGQRQRRRAAWPLPLQATSDADGAAPDVGGVQPAASQPEPAPLPAAAAVVANGTGDAVSLLPVAAAASAAGAGDAAAAAAAATNGRSSGSSGSLHHGKHAAAAADSQTQPLFGKDLARVWRLATPLMVNNIAGYALSIVGAVYIGRLGALPLSASVLANSVYNCTGLSLALGLSAGMETLCGQAYGAGAYKRVGVVLQRALLVCWSVCLPICLMWLASHQLLLQLGQEPEIAALASRYLVLCIPCLFLTTTLECLRKYLQSQRAVKPAMAVAAATLAASPLVFWLFVESLGWGLDGAALAFVACQSATLAGLLGYVVFRAWQLQGHKQQTWGGWSREAFRGWGEYASYGLPAAAMIALEWWAYEVIILMSGLLPDASVALSTMGICLNINAWMYMLPLGLGGAVNTSVSNALGAGHAATAKRAFVGGVASGVLMQAALCAVIVTRGDALVRLFTSDAAVIASCSGVLPLLAGLVFFDGVNAVVSGVLRGSGRQLLGAGVNAFGYFVVGVPLAAFLAFNAGLGLPGFWYGVSTGACVQAVVLLVLLSRWDWGAEAARVQAIMQGGGGQLRPSLGH